MVAGYPAHIYALKYLPRPVLSLYAYGNPVNTVLLGTLLLAEPFGVKG
jgi:drug/metabolite transporter (DMT)-like permease